MPRQHIHYTSEPSIWRGFGIAALVDFGILLIGGFLWWLVRR